MPRQRSAIGSHQVALDTPARTRRMPKRELLMMRTISDKRRQQQSEER
jgi:hypothetical protein